MASGIICEYNPFHKGHLYHIEATRRLSGDPDIICIMSGNYTQRGEPAITDKWTRTRMALATGADLVIELPTYYSTASASDFAFGAVRLACCTGLIRHLSFGVEPDSLPVLPALSSLLSSRASTMDEAIRSALHQGLSYPQARESAIRALAQDAGLSLPPTFFSPNAILGLEYLLQLLQASSRFSFVPAPLLVPRRSSGYHDLDPEAEFPSASALRRLLLQSEDITDRLPSDVQDIWADALRLGRAPVLPDTFSPFLQAALLRHSADSLRRVIGVREGLEHRILQQSASYPSWSVLLDRLATKRYPTASLRRVLLNILLDITQERRAAAGFSDGPAYLRILGFRREKETLLRQLCADAALPVITSLSQLPSLSPSAAQALQDEIFFSDLYLAGLPEPSGAGRGFEYRAGLIRF